jgi:hypothetical protein
LKFGEKLIQVGIIDRAQLDGALRHQEQTGQRLGESLLELGYISEQNLLYHLAKEFNTQYVSSKKLAGIAVDPALLELIPVKLAETHLVFPILLDRENNQLGVISCEPQGFEGLEEARIVSGMDTVRVYVAQRDAIRALIKKHYQGDVHAFGVLSQEKQNKFDKTKVGTLFDGRVVKVMEEMAFAKPTPPGSKAPEQATLTLSDSEDTAEISGVVIEVETESEVEKEERLPTPSSTSFAGVGSQGKILSGLLENRTALSLIRALVARKHSGHLGLRTGELKGEILFENGHVFEALLGKSEGEEAFLELAAWKDCLYRFDPGKIPTARSIKTPTAKLLQIAKLSME